jgi:hypothetical protein
VNRQHRCRLLEGNGQAIAALSEYMYPVWPFSVSLPSSYSFRKFLFSFHNVFDDSVDQAPEMTTKQSQDF